MANQLSRAAYNQQRAIQRGLLGRGEIPDTSLLGRFVEDTQVPGAASGFAKGLLSGAVGLPADVLSLMNMPLAASPYNAGAQKLQGLLQPFTSDGIAEKLGADPSRMTTQAGLIGAPDPGDIGKVAMRAGQDGLLGAMTLFHGTPHKFDNFDLKAIGTGEGAQAYGHGLYFAENPKVAKQYQQDLSGGDYLAVRDKKGQLIAGGPTVGDAEVQAASMLEGAYIPNASDEAKKLAKEWKQMGVVSGYERLPGHLYEVDIPDDTIGKMLDWDAPLSEQPEIKAALSEVVETGRISASIGTSPDEKRRLLSRLELIERDVLNYEKGTGSDAYHYLINLVGDDAAASDLLREAGIPGIRYFDGASRNPASHARKPGNPAYDIAAMMREFDISFDAPDDVDWLQRELTARGLKDNIIPEIKDFFDRGAKLQTSNIVLFDPNDIRKVNRDGKMVFDGS